MKAALPTNRGACTWCGLGRRMAYGFRDEPYFCLKIRAFGGIAG
jgi:hypothetical protein